ncbi:MAG: ABC transporter ATP-binding protein [Proteobacteria bacterium]|nr:ABC transporter ATP-binding protein [Pseudomonadota bacterium]
MTASVLKTQSLGKTFDTPNGGLSAIADLSFSVSPGEFLCIVGPSGCGKTTLLQLLGGLLPASRGRVLLADDPLLEPHPDISIVFQKPNLMPWRTVLENILLPLKIDKVPYGEAKKRAREMLAKVGLEDFESAYPKALSGGMEQRVAVARAMVRHPRILLLDEPFGALDALTRERLNLELLRLWRNQNLTAIMVTHNIHEAVLLADRVLVLSPRPATLSSEFTIDLPRPRHQDVEFTPDFVDLAFKIRHAIKE